MGAPSTAAGVVGGVSGTITQVGTGAAISAATVDLWSLDGELAATTTSDLGGHYAFEAGVLVSGTSYFVAVAVDGYSYEESAIFQYTGAAVAQDVQLNPLVLIAAGTVTDASTGLPVAGAQVDAWVWESGDFAFPVGFAVTDADGTYAIYDEFQMLQSGDYIAFDVYSDGYETFNASSTNGVTYTGSPFTFDVELSLAPLVASGTVTDAQTGLPIADAEVDAWVWEDGDYSVYVGYGITDACGHYEIRDSSGMLQSGDYIAFDVYAGGYEPFVGNDANGVRYQGGAVLFDVQLSVHRLIATGTAWDSDTGEPLEGVSVEVSIWEADAEGAALGIATTDAEGRYQVYDEKDTLDSGDYVMITFAADGYGSEPVMRDSGQTVRYAGAPLVRNCRMSSVIGWGTVLDADTGLPVVGADICLGVYGPQPSQPGANEIWASRTNQDGLYWIYGREGDVSIGNYISVVVQMDGYAPFRTDAGTVHRYEGMPFVYDLELAPLIAFTLEDRAVGVTFDRFVPCASASYSGGSYVYGRWTGTRIEARFTGTDIVWIGPKQPNYGKADVYIDDRKVATVDCYASASSAVRSAVLFRCRDYEGGQIDYGPHTISIRLTGAKNVASTGNIVVVDNFRVITTSAANSYERSNETVGTFSGSWVNCNNSVYTGGTYRYSRWAGAKIRYTFTGTKIAWLGPRSFNYGRADVYIDGARWATVSQYGVLGWRYRVWESQALWQGTHTLEIRVLGAKDPASSGTIVVVDGFDVTP